MSTWNVPTDQELVKRLCGVLTVIVNEFGMGEDNCQECGVQADSIATARQVLEWAERARGMC